MRGHLFSLVYILQGVSMYVRVLTGRYAGEIRDIRSDAAKQMLADGRATDPYDEASKTSPSSQVEEKQPRRRRQTNG
jgi:hypothetical protein